MDVDGANVRTIYDPTDATDTMLFPAGAYDPSWSSDDEWILVEKPIEFSGSGENGSAGVWHIIKVRIDGTETEDLTQEGELADCALYLPSFSPDGQWIILSSRCGPEEPSQVSLDIYKMIPDGTSIQKLTSSSYWAQFPIWLKMSYNREDKE
jgi:Tol biopolymer transport system component